MQKKTRSILDEITTLVPQRDKHLVVENLALQAIARITNLVKIIETSYPKHQSDELVRRLQLSIKNNDPAKFTRGVRAIKESEEK
jgi:hypothetical protein